MNQTTPVLSQCTVTDYRHGVTSPRQTPQRTIRVDDELWQQAQAIAEVRRERVASVIRAALVQYVNEHRHLLSERS